MTDLNGVTINITLKEWEELYNYIIYYIDYSVYPLITDLLH